ncbi:hypothetical protein PSPO01_13401 [Paraphaeosphaeria sporulosa]
MEDHGGPRRPGGRWASLPGPWRKRLALSTAWPPEYDPEAAVIWILVSNRHGFSTWVFTKRFLDQPCKRTHADATTLPSARACPALDRCDAVSSTHAVLLGPAVVALPCSHHLVALLPFSFAGFADASIRPSEATGRCHGRSRRPPPRGTTAG